MADKFTYSMLDIVVGQMYLHVGFDKCKLTALVVTTDVLYNYIKKLFLRIGMYTELACRTEPTLQDVLLAFKDYHISVDDLQQYMKQFGEGPRPMKVPKYPISRENHLNFLRPGSRELITRPLHIHEHLPPMYTELEIETIRLNRLSAFSQIPNVIDKTEKKDDLSKTCGESEMLDNDENTGKPMRELKSILMTSSGFISSSCVGVHPESKLLEKEEVCMQSCSSGSIDAQTEKIEVCSKKTIIKKQNPNPEKLKNKIRKPRKPKSNTQAAGIDRKKQICLKKIMMKFNK